MTVLSKLRVITAPPELIPAPAELTVTLFKVITVLSKLMVITVPSELVTFLCI